HAQKVVRPLDRRAQRPMARCRVASSAQQVEPLRQTLENLSRRERDGPSRGQLDRQGKAVEPPAELGDRLVRNEARPLTEEIGRLALAERIHRIRDLAADLQELAARNEQTQVLTGLDERRELRRRVDHLLDVVEQQEELALADVLRDILL